MIEIFTAEGAWILWLILLVLLVFIEAATVSLTTIWFACGALAALITAALGGNVWLQITLFFAISLLTLIFTRPLAKKWLLPKKEATNLDQIIGRPGRVTETIDNLSETGEVYIDGKAWTARSEKGSIIPEGTTVTAVRIAGVKLIVNTTQEETEHDSFNPDDGCRSRK